MASGGRVSSSSSGWRSRSEFTERDYARVRQLGDEYRACRAPCSGRGPALAGGLGSGRGATSPGGHELEVVPTPGRRTMAEFSTKPSLVRPGHPEGLCLNQSGSFPEDD